MYRKTIRIFVIAIMGFMISFCAHAFDIKDIKQLPGNIHIGNLRIHPYVNTSMGYTDNIFREASHEKGSMIYKVDPGICFQWAIMQHFIQLDYHADIQRSERFHQEYDTEDHYLTGLIHLNFNRINILLSDNWQRAANLPDYQGDIRINIIRISLGVRYPIN